jgi:hypothetical protein
MLAGFGVRSGGWTLFTADKAETNVEMLSSLYALLRRTARSEALA